MYVLLVCFLGVCDWDLGLVFHCFSSCFCLVLHLLPFVGWFETSFG